MMAPEHLDQARLLGQEQVLKQKLLELEELDLALWMGEKQLLLAQGVIAAEQLDKAQLLGLEEVLQLRGQGLGWEPMRLVKEPGFEDLLGGETAPIQSSAVWRLIAHRRVWALISWTSTAEWTLARCSVARCGGSSGARHKAAGKPTG
eukprot:TRINITY_DN5150_c0_g2_i2.p2 TRINITY_DN5150_c0_g2~~TRINITY_DN5150_c0_g2_i2.p2  ORF type:complete len:148 (+),score=20.70 TRINITY_DN5150_c0_g2_i2:128-571(+)